MIPDRSEVRSEISAILSGDHAREYKGAFVKETGPL